MMTEFSEIQKNKLEIAKNVMDIIKNHNPRIGGSCALFLQDKKDDFRDVDIIVDNIDGINLKYNIIPLLHDKRLNRTLKYDINGVEIDIIEGFDKDEPTIELYGSQVCLFENVMKHKEKIKKFLKEEYGERGN